MSSRYFSGLDNIKVLGLYLMILGHAGLVDSNIQTFIYSFHMPLFFIISGFLYKQRPFKEQLRRSWRALMVPYLLLNLILFIYYALIAYNTDSLNFDFIYSRGIPILIGLGYSTGSFIPSCEPMWFFFVLFFIQVLSSLVEFKSRNLILLTSICVVLVALLCALSINTLVPIDSFLMSFPFFIFGYVIKNLTIDFTSIRTKILSVILFIAGTYLSYINGRVDVAHFEYGNNIILFYIVAMGLSMSLIMSLLYTRGGIL